jgi:hypothetical protein
MTLTGLADLQDFIESVAIAGATNAYAEWTSKPRTDSRLGNGDLIDYLADGGRDIRPDDKDATDATNVYATEVLRQIDRNTKNELYNAKHASAIAAGTKKARNIKELSELTKAGIVGGLRKAIGLLANRMAERAANQKNTNRSMMRRVSEAYAKRRKKDHGVSENIVYTASGQLGDALLEKRYIIHMDKKPGINTLRMHSFAAKRRGMVKSQIKQKAKLKAQKAKARSARKPRKK